MQYPRALPQVMHRLLLGQMSEDRQCVHQRKFAVSHRKQPDPWAVRVRVEERVVHVMMIETEVRRRGLQVPLTPADHAGMKVNSDVSFGTRALLHQLPRYSSTAASEVKDALVNFRSEVRVNRIAAGIVECRGVGWADQLPHLQRRDR